MLSQTIKNFYQSPLLSNHLQLLSSLFIIKTAIIVLIYILIIVIVPIIIVIVIIVF